MKRPAESRLYGMDFSALLASGETVSAVSSFAADTPAGATALTVGAPTVTSPAAFARISGGTAGYTYHVTVTVTTSLGNTLQECGDLQVAAC